MEALRRQGPRPSTVQFVGGAQHGQGHFQQGGSNFHDNFFEATDFDRAMPAPGFHQPADITHQNAASFTPNSTLQHGIANSIATASHLNDNWTALQHADQPYRDYVNNNPAQAFATPRNDREIGLCNALREYQERNPNFDPNNIPQVPTNLQPGARDPQAVADKDMPRTSNTSTRAATEPVSPEGDTPPEREPVVPVARRTLEDAPPTHRELMQLNKDKLCPIIIDIWKEARQLMQDNAKLGAKFADLKATNKELAKLNESLVKNGAKASTNAATLNELAKIYRTKLFPKAPFIRNIDESERVAGQMYKHLFAKNPAKLEDTSYKVTWVNGYKSNVNKICNKRRSYIQSQCKIAVFNFYEEHEEMPSLEDILRCAKRDLDFDKNPGDYAMMKWYWGNIAPKVVGCSQWSESKKFYTLMSTAHYNKESDKDDDILLFPASTEAYIYIMVDNCHTKWHEMAKLLKKRGNFKAKLGVTKKTKAQKKKEAAAAKASTGDDDSGDEEEAPLDCEEANIDAMFEAKYSSAENGQVFSSFSKDGRKEHARVRKLIETARQSENYADVEADFLERYRKEFKIVGSTYAEQCKLKGKNKRKRGAGDGHVIMDDQNETLDSDEDEIVFTDDEEE